MLLLCLFVAVISPIVASTKLESEFMRLKSEIHTLTGEQAVARIEELRALHDGDPPPPRQDKVDHVVVLLMENHAFDQMLGCMNLKGADGVPPEGHLIPIDPSDPTKGNVTQTCGTGEYVCKGGPGYNLFSSKFKKGANDHTYPYDPQSDLNSYPNGASGVAMTAFAPKQIPIKYALAKEFGVFNKYYASVPSASTPNHLMIQSATSCGIVDNIRYCDCGGSTCTFPQMTIYDSMYVNNVSFSLFLNSTCGIDGNPHCHGMDPNNPNAGSPIPTPDVAMSGVGRYKDRFLSQQLFYENAAQGTLPALSWMLPPIEACDHPCYDIAKGERLLKDIYEALRAGPKWEKTLLFVVYDDPGAFYDHVVPPFKGVPNDDAPCHIQDQCGPTRSKFDFRRLGLRATAMLISPLVSKASVFQEPKGPMPTSQFEHTSVPATLKNLFNLTGFLTKRDMWAGSFDELLLETPRTDAPMHLPTAPKNATPWGPPPNLTDATEFAVPHTRDTHDTDKPISQHCSLKEQTCHGPDHVNQKQKKNMQLLSDLVPGLEVPDISSLNNQQANVWIRQAWEKYMAITPLLEQEL